jgi:hypothetical protein
MLDSKLHISSYRQYSFVESNGPMGVMIINSSLVLMFNHGDRVETCIGTDLPIFTYYFSNLEYKLRLLLYLQLIINIRNCNKSLQLSSKVSKCVRLSTQEFLSTVSQLIFTASLAKLLAKTTYSVTAGWSCTLKASTK